MIKEKYEPAEIEVSLFQAVDVIATSIGEEYEDEIINQGG